MLAGQVGIAGHLHVGDGVIAAGQAGIAHDLPAGAFVQGSPAMPQRDWLKASLVFPRLPDLAKRLRARILQASTSEVYGDPDVHPQPEEYWGRVNPIGIRSCYDEGKRCAETLFFDYYRQHKIDIRVARIFNTYGPRMHPNDGRVVSNFVVQALKGQDITLYGDGLQTRSFCYVDDLIDAFIAFMDKDGDLPGPINLGNPGEFSIRELADLVIEMTGSKSKLIQLPLPQDDPRQRRPDIALAKKHLNWEPKISLREGLRNTIGYFDRLLTEGSNEPAELRDP